MNSFNFLRGLRQCDRVIANLFTGAVRMFQAKTGGVTDHIFSNILFLLSREDMIWNR